MYSSKFFAVAPGFLTVLLNAAPTSPNPNLMSKDWRHVLTPDNFLASTIEPGSSMASVLVPGMASDPNVPQIRGEVRNHCSFSVWARLSISPISSGPSHEKCDNLGETSMVEIKPGQRYKAPFPCQMNQCGHVIKVAYHPADLRVYQIEYSVDSHDGRMWYNLSAEDGAPFQDVERYLGGRGPTCPFVHCAPGQYGKDPVHGCDWPLQPLCNSLGSVVAVICGRL
ncbi:hypothetical protein AA0113_g431 [Alternaria arborescens]|uniref:AA1-like domain-containing protein n=1 Tax=Alternaria arborescens TaxID=156630 RepID=A0A4Q4SPI7_9PLEO|nr:hypothetical protein AA0111_g3409 [Alternaria arborescens]RYO34976.1 hypothetical protein AA0111_g3409 [Alternaria arborescens]RYO72804.1 hypothetical protein AA0113_g431 [Alternaria arborescens]